MPVKTKNIAFCFVLLSLIGAMFSSASSGAPIETGGIPHIIVTDSYGCKLIRDGRAYPPGLLDSLFVGFENLDPGKTYSLHMKRSDGREINRFYKIADRYGVIAEFALWQDMEIKYGEGSMEIDPEFLNYEYSCILKKEGAAGPIIETSLPLVKQKPLIYSSDRDGNPQNVFITKTDDVYVTGKNFLDLGRGLCVYLVTYRKSRREQSRLKNHIIIPYKIRLKKGQAGFRLRLCKSGYLRPGLYDIIVNDHSSLRINKDSLIDGNEGVGFEVVETDRKDDIIRDLACQEPCLLISGNGVELPRPAFKDYFAPVEEVWVALDPHNIGWAIPAAQDVKKRCSLSEKITSQKTKIFAPSSKGRFDQKVRLYIINHRELSDKIPLDDVSGGYETVDLKFGPGEFIFKRVWEKPEVREGGYDVVVDLNCNGSYDKGIDIVDTGVKGGYYVPEHWVYLESISFGKPGKPGSHDAVKIDLREGKDDPAGECHRDWRRGKYANPAAYLTRSRVIVYAKIEAEQDVFQVRLKAEKRSGMLGDLKSEYVYLKKSGKIREKIEPFQATRYTPRKIRSLYQVWGWYLERIKLRGKSTVFSRVHIATTMHKIYIILNEPQYPWGVYEGRAPWLRVLDIACLEAEGAVNPLAAAAKITRYLYSDKKIKATYTTASSYSKNNTPAGGFRLADFLNKIPKGVGKVNCYDMGKALVTFSNALGCGLDLMYFKSVTIDPIKLNRVRPVGWDTDRGNPDNFENHAFTEMENKVFDASIKINRSGIKKYFHPIWITGISKGRYLKLLVEKADITEPEITEFEIEAKKPNKK